MDYNFSFYLYFEEIRKLLEDINKNAPFFAAIYSHFIKDLEEFEAAFIHQINLYQEKFAKFETERDKIYNLSLEKLYLFETEFIETINEHQNEMNFNIDEVHKLRDYKLKELTKDLNILSIQQNTDLENIPLSYQKEFSDLEKELNKINSQQHIINNRYLDIVEKLTDDAQKKSSSLLTDKNHIETLIIENKNKLGIEHTKIIDFFNTQAETKKDELQKIKKDKETLNIKQAIELNNTISNISTDFKKWRGYGEVPFLMEKNSLVEEMRSKQTEFTKMEAKILADFKANLEKTDQKLDAYRIEYQLKKEAILRRIHNNSYQTQYRINSKKKETEVLIKKLDKDSNLAKNIISKQKKTLWHIYNIFIKNVHKEFKINEKLLKREFLDLEIENILMIEQTRTDKQLFETIKTTEIKNFNIEKQYFTDIKTYELEMNTLKIEKYNNLDHLEEVRKINEVRYIKEIERLQINNEILQLNQKIHSIENRLKLNLNYLEQDYYYQTFFLEQKEAITSSAFTQKINQIDVNSMLEIEYAKILRNYNLNNNLLYLKKQQIKKQYYENDQLLNKKATTLRYNRQVAELNQEIENILSLVEFSEAEMQLQKTILDRETKANHLRQIGETRLNLYESRFETEKKILSETYHNYYSCGKIIKDFSEKTLELIVEYNADIEKNQSETTFSAIFNKLINLSINLLNSYYEQERMIINDRISFENDLKYKNILESIESEKNTLIQKHHESLYKINQTIENYEKTVKLFYSNILHSEQKMQELNSDLLKFQKQYKNHRDETLIGVIEHIRMEITKNKEKVTHLKTNIDRNERSIYELEKRIPVIKKKMDFIIRKHDKQQKSILKAQILEAKIYSLALEQLTDIKNKEIIKLKAEISVLSADNLMRKDSAYILQKYRDHNFFYWKESNSLHHQYLQKLIKNVGEEHQNFQKNYMSNFMETNKKIKIDEMGEKNALDKKRRSRSDQLLSKKIISDIEYAKNIEEIDIKKRTSQKEFLNMTSDIETQQYKNRLKLSNDLSANRENLKNYNLSIRKTLEYYEKVNVESLKKLQNNLAKLQKNYYNNYKSYETTMLEKDANLLKLKKINLNQLSTESKEKERTKRQEIKMARRNEVQLLHQIKAYIAIKQSEADLEKRNHAIEYGVAVSNIKRNSKLRARKEIRKYQLNVRKKQL